MNVIISIIQRFKMLENNEQIIEYLKIIFKPHHKQQNKEMFLIQSGVDWINFYNYAQIKTGGRGLCMANTSVSFFRILKWGYSLIIK